MLESRERGEETSVVQGRVYSVVNIIWVLGRGEEMVAVRWRRWGVRPGNECWRVLEVDVDEFKLPVELRIHVVGRGRIEREERAAEEIVAVKICILIIVIPGVFALIHRESIFLYVEKNRGGIMEGRR